MLEGGVKTWTDRVFTLEPGSPAWREAGVLPSPYAYGASASLEDGLLCIGGCDQKGHRRDVYLLGVSDGTLIVSAFPSLPVGLAYTAAAVLDGKVYLTGGCEYSGEQDCTNRMFMLDSANPGQGWQELPALPGRGRFLHQMASVNGVLYVLGGIGLKEENGRQVRELLTEAWSFTPSGGWTRQPDMPYAIAAAPTPAPVSRSGVIYLLAGTTALAGNTRRRPIPASTTSPCAWTRQRRNGTTEALSEHRGRCFPAAPGKAASSRSTANLSPADAPPKSGAFPFPDFSSTNNKSYDALLTLPGSVHQDMVRGPRLPDADGCPDRPRILFRGCPFRRQHS